MELQLGPNDPLLARALYVRADVLTLEKRKAEAKVLYNRAQDLMQTFQEATDVRELQAAARRK